MSKTKQLTYVTMLIALAIVVNVAENAFLPELPMGIRFGLANIISLVTIKLFTRKEMLVVNIMRVSLANLITGTIFGTKFFIALGGIAFSSLALILTDKINSSVVFSSIVSSFAHMVGQIMIVCFIYNTAGMVLALPLYVVSAVGTGIVTGMIANEALKRVRI